MSKLSADQKVDFMKLMNEAVQLFKPSASDDQDHKELIVHVTNFRKILSQVRPGRNFLFFYFSNPFNCINLQYVHRNLPDAYIFQLKCLLGSVLFPSLHYML